MTSSPFLKLKNSKKALILLIISCWAMQINAQDKLEREFAIDPALIPENAMQSMKDVDAKKPFKWFKEISADKFTFEAKGTWNHKQTSIEFDKYGNLEDIEITEKLRAIPDAIGNNITTTLSTDSSRFKINKIQFQYLNTGEPLTVILEKIQNKELVPHYELIVSLKTDGNFERYEYLFDTSGIFIKRLRLVERNDFNIQF